jgi:hypothetical protein
MRSVALLVIGMAAAFIVSAIDMINPLRIYDLGPIGGVFVIGVGMLALGYHS